MSEANTAEPTRRAHQPEGIHVRAIAWTGVVVAATLVALSFIIFQMNHRFLETYPAAPPPNPGAIQSTFTDPRLQPSPQAEIEAFNAQKDAMLHGYRWIDKEHGVVHIPIERAMELLAQDKKPGRE